MLLVGSSQQVAVFKMNSSLNKLPKKLFETIERAGLSTKQIITLPIWDIKKLTKLCNEDIIFIKNLVCDNICPKSVTCDIILKCQVQRVTTGCEKLDGILHNGFRNGTLTEIYGESGSGKTQLAMQAAIHNWQTGSVFICTEDLFPVKRFEQLKKSLPYYDPSVDYGQNIFVEHVTESMDLLYCIRMRLPQLLKKHNVSMIIVDSVAAPFRSETTNYIQRAEELRELAILLTHIAQEYNLAVICINQVTASFDENIEILPSLGLAWSNMVSTRLWIKRTTDKIDSEVMKHLNDKKNNHTMNIRELYVIFAPDVAKSVIRFIITEKGICII